MSLKFEISKIKNFLIYALLFLASMNFQAKFFYFVFGATIVMALLGRYFIMDYGAFIYLTLGVLMAIYNNNEGILSMIRCLAPFCFYLVGINMATDRGKDLIKDEEFQTVENQSFKLLLVIASGSFVHYLINYIYNFGHQLGRNTNDIWSGEPMAATAQNTLACLMLGLATAMIFLPKKKWHRVVGVLSLCAILLYNLVLAGRTIIVISVCLLIAGMIYKRVNRLSKLSNTFFYAFLCLIVVFLIFTFNIANLREYIINSELFDRFDNSWINMFNDGSRTDTKLNFLKDAIHYPIGGLNLRKKYGYAHDLLLDGYDEYGFVALVLMIAMLAVGLKNVIKNIRYTSFSHEFKLALLLMYISVLLDFTVEPILAGMPWLFSCYSLINGCVVGMNRSYYKKEYK